MDKQISLGLQAFNSWQSNENNPTVVVIDCDGCLSLAMAQSSRGAKLTHAATLGHREAGKAPFSSSSSIQTTLLLPLLSGRNAEREENKEPTVRDWLSYATALPSVGTNDVDHHQIIITSTSFYPDNSLLEYSTNENREENVCQLSIRL